MPRPARAPTEHSHTPRGLPRANPLAYSPGMRGKSKLWLASAGLLAGAAGLGAASVALYWQPCAGQFLNGSVVNGYRIDQEFTGACLAAMDGAPVALLSTGPSLWALLGAGATALLALAWLVLVPTMTLPRASRLGVALPGLLVLAQVAVVSGAGFPAAFTGLAFVVELSVVLALVVLAAAGVRGAALFRYGIVLLAATASGWFHILLGYIGATMLSEANWDSPPGTGGLAVLAIALTAVLTVVLWHRDGRTRSAAVPEPELADALQR